jgi:phosphoserine phosphatase RsbU/P
MYSPEDTMRGVDSVMRQLMGEEQYLTACYARLNRETRRLSVISAGHPPLILVTANRKAQLVQMDGDPLGVFSSAVLQRKEIRVSRGDRFFLYTDGLMESSPGSGRREGLEKLVDACVRHRAALLAESAGMIARELRPESSMIKDDLLLLAVDAFPADATWMGAQL